MTDGATATTGSAEGRPWHILPVIVVGQFAGTSMWFAGNAVLPDLQAHLQFEGGVAPLTSSVQLGFIAGTLLLAMSGLADRFSARATFLFCAMGGAAANLAVLAAGTLPAVLSARFATGLFLAGVYPIGMKIAAGWYRAGLGRALGLLVGALVLGTAFPHLLRGLGAEVPWRWVIIGTSLMSAAGGAAVYAAVPDGPWIRQGTGFDPGAIVRVFRIAEFRRAALGYFGHMWELYTVWALVPLLLALHVERGGPSLSISLWSAAIIGVGFVGCAVGGLLSKRVGSKTVAAASLVVSGVCCLVAAWLPGSSVFLPLMLVWGVAVVADSPQFSALNAGAAPPELVGTGLTVVTALGFALTIVSVQLVDALPSLSVALPVLAIGPALGLLGLFRG
jgi:MFS family permease